MTLAIAGGGSHPALLAGVADALGLTPVTLNLATYPDAEVVSIEGSVRGADLFVVQSTPPPSQVHAFELLQIADAARRAGADRITAVIPFLGYSRQDRRAAGRQSAIGARVLADMLGSGAIDRIVTVDLHQPAVEGFYAIPVEHLEAFPLLVAALRDAPRDAVVVAPDLGATKLADRIAAALDLPFAVVHKTRTSGVTVESTRVTGAVAGRRPLVVDDMITTGRTVAAALSAVAAHGATGPATVAATHAILSDEAPGLLAELPIARLIMTDSVPVANGRLRGFESVSLAPLLAEAVRRLHGGDSLQDLLSRR